MNILTTEQLYKAAPSLFTHGAAEHTSERYQPIATSDIINVLLQEGFYPTKATQSASRHEERKAFAKHMVRFRHRNYHEQDGGLFPELVLVNSHDGMSSYRLMAGLYRQICTNGMVAGKNYNEVRVRHQGDVIGNVIEGTYQVVESSHRMLDAVEQMEGIQLTNEKLLDFAQQAHALRFSEDDNLVIEAKTLLTPRRREDMKRDLFSVLNVVQENLIKGGLPGYRQDEKGRWRRARSRQIKAIDQNIKINRDLWSIAENTLLSCP
ncbi:TPA: DUF932 domain-containing protein [Legionella pneumophila]|jgi:hypothetical protein|uniref:DUF932 domain-containing protein n=1 Tax=unclassified Legionella TaxID=2622702 RepID=UPI000CA7F1C9|nr:MULTISPECIES: DUF932 domain-containing protein [unclassified Legionella]MDW9185968.1 DUF932 domain-containing protein [Legionella pneumophila]HAT9261843.1 DUF932 domain-containing protein [Legionella pneumophila subsp. pneumophila]MBN9229531.1 DUF945 domain-containing protein [Legionella sp.]PJE14443.1 MAG: hypothetical protein CK430_05045 [Legionella sp.]QLZ71007.1 hypothetical protein FOLKNPGA_03827 [Legionella sp. PC1000]